MGAQRRRCWDFEGSAGEPVGQDDSPRACWTRTGMSSNESFASFGNTPIGMSEKVTSRLFGGSSSGRRRRSRYVLVHAFVVGKEAVSSGIDNASCGSCAARISCATGRGQAVGKGLCGSCVEVSVCLRSFPPSQLVPQSRTVRLRKL